MSSINRQPRGLLGFLGIKNAGENPGELSHTMAPVWDLAQLYLVNACEYGTRNDAITAPSTVIGDGPPFGEIWYIHEYGARTGTLAAAETINFCVGIYGPTGTNIFVPTTSIEAASAVTGDRFCVAAQRPIILTPGDSMGLFVTDCTTAGNITVTSTYRFTRMVA